MAALFLCVRTPPDLTYAEEAPAHRLLQTYQLNMIKHLRLLALLLIVAAYLTSCEDENETAKPEGKLVALAGEDRSVPVNTEAALDASASYSENQKPFTFHWTVKTKPPGSNALPASPQSAKTTFTPDVAGVYVVELEIKQEGRSATDQVVITATQGQTDAPQTVILNQDIMIERPLEDIFPDDTPDYIITEDIHVRADLTISPGVTILVSENKSLYIIGKLNAMGTAAKPITFKGYENEPAYWRGLIVYSNSTENTLDHVHISGAGSVPIEGTVTKASVYLDGSSVTGAFLNLSNTTIAQSGGYGLFVSGMSELGIFSANTFAENAYAAAYIPARMLHVADATSAFTGNAFDGIETYGPVFANGEVTHWKKLNNASYLISNNLSILSGVVIEPGTMFKIRPHAVIDISEDGYLNATATALEPIAFTAHNGYWNGIVFNTGSEHNALRHVEVSNAGFETIGDAMHAANIVVGPAGKVSIKQSIIKNGLGYGVAAISRDQLNEDITLANEFVNLAKGNVFPQIIEFPDLPSLTGEWLDEWSFQNNRTSPSDKFYDEGTEIWFEGAADPWTMPSDKGLGIVITEDQTFIWAAAQVTTWTGCENYNAEFMKGSVAWDDETITFTQTYWRSKFRNVCDPSQDADLEVETGVIALPYRIEKMHNPITSEEFWKLTFTNPDNTTFSYYRK